MISMDDRVVGAPCWADLQTPDIDQALDFYGSVFDWTAERGDEATYGGYTTFFRDGEKVAGVMQRQPEDVTPSAWTTYLLTLNAAATTTAIAEAGGTVVFEPMDVPSMGVMGFAIDPSGAAIGYWQPGGHEGWGAYGVPNSVAWTELHTTDFRAATDFYQRAFDWTFTVAGDTDEFRYSNFQKGEQLLAGVMDGSAWLTESTPSAWQLYIGSSDVDATVARALEKGATIVEVPEVTPYGTLAGITDPGGAYLKLRSV